MHLNVNKVRRGDKVYCYARLVESYRRKKDGKPTIRVLANLGKLSEREIGNFRLALAASRGGNALVCMDALDAEHEHCVVESLSYLDVAVALELWRDCGLDRLLSELAAGSRMEVPVSEVAAALTIHRMVCPGSKRSAQRWFNRTALPALLGIEHTQFNNSRLHRFMEWLESKEEVLQQRLSAQVSERVGGFISLFIDATETWFEGHGPELAESSKMKDGSLKMRLGLLLLCDEHGTPIRWHVLPGRSEDSRPMRAMLKEIKDASWAAGVPVVCDRAMGHTAIIDEVLDADIYLVTALVRSEFDAYTDKVPHQAFADFELTGKEHKDADARQAAQLALQNGMKRADDTLYILDLGTVCRGLGQHTEDALLVDGVSPEPGVRPEEDPALSSLLLAERLKAQLESGEAVSMQALARQYGKSRGWIKTRLLLLNLLPELKEAIRRGEAQGVGPGSLSQVAGHKRPAMQRLAFKQSCARANRRLANGHKSTSSSRQPSLQLVRAVAYFNPRLFVDKRTTAARQLAELNALVEEVNKRLSNRRYGSASAVATIQRRLRKLHWIQTFQVEVRGGKKSRRIEIVRDEQRWSQQRRYDGFSLLIAHPELPHAAEQLCRLYRSRDLIEKDFQVIKSCLKLRPVYHYTDHKVRAHVTICMLALFLERALKRKLQQAGAGISAAAALEELRSCMLNRLVPTGCNEALSYSVLTQPTSHQLAVLGALHLERLTTHPGGLP